jgi:hypothetical protein
MSSGQLDIVVYLQDRDAFTVTTTLLDHNIWDMTRARHKWPNAQDAPLTWMGFLAWSAARRTGAIEQSLTWEQFLAQCLSVERPDDDEEAGKTADPTQPVPGLDSFVS